MHNGESRIYLSWSILDSLYQITVFVLDFQVILKNLPPNSSLINEIVERVKGFLVSKALLKGDSSTASHSLRHIRGESVSLCYCNY